MRIKSLIKSFLVDNFREFYVVFWSFVFPAVLFFFFVVLFGGVFSNTEDITLRVGINYQEELKGISKNIFEDVFENIEKSEDSGFAELYYYKNKEDGISELKNKKLDIFLNFPEKFSLLDMKLLLPNMDTPSLEVYSTVKNDSEIAKNIINSIIKEINLQISNNNQTLEFDINHINIDAQKKDFEYKDFLFPGILMLSIMTLSIFNIPLGIVDYTEKGVMKRFNVTPVKGKEVFSAFMICNFIVLLISMIILYFEAYMFKVNSTIYSLKFILYLIFAMITTLSIGLLIASFFKKTSTASAVSNVIFQLTMFLSGTYFNVQNSPWVIRWYVLSNPVTYLNEGLRNIIFDKGLNVNNFLIPIVWFIVSLIVFSINYKRVMKYE